MQAQYGYQDGSGSYYITLDTELCDGCGDCVPACPQQLFQVGEDEMDPFIEREVAFVVPAQRNHLRYACEVCKPASKGMDLPCVTACPPGAIAHSW